MLIENRFAVAAPPDQVHLLLCDVERVIPCIPSAELVGREDDGSYKAKATVKLGPVKMTYQGQVAVEEVDSTQRRCVIHARGTELRGQGRAEATMTVLVAEQNAGDYSVVDVSTDVLVSGRIAQMGRGVLEDVAVQLVGQMAEAIETELNAATGANVRAASDQPAELSGFRLFWAVLRARLRRLFRRPAR